MKVSTNELLVQTFILEPVYEASTKTVLRHNYLGQAYPMTVPVTVCVGTNKVEGMEFVLRNYPAQFAPAIAQTISFRAMKVGTINCDGNILELWDCGTPHVAMVVATNYPHGFKTKK